MANKKADGDAKGSSGLRRLLVPVVALVLGVVVGPRLLGGGSGSGEAAAETTTTTAPGSVVTLETITVNLSDGHLLKLGLALQISAEWEAEHGGEHAEEEVDTTDPTRGYARALDAAITVFSERTMDDLLQAAGRESARTELNVRLEEAYHGEIEGVYLYEFVMQ